MKPDIMDARRIVRRIIEAEGEALPVLSNPQMEVVIDDWPIGRQRCKAWFAVETGPRGERVSRRTENKSRTGWNAPKYTTYAMRACIVDGDDGRRL